MPFHVEEMSDSRSGAENVQDEKKERKKENVQEEPGASYHTRKQAKTSRVVSKVKGQLEETHVNQRQGH